MKCTATPTVANCQEMHQQAILAFEHLGLAFCFTSRAMEMVAVISPSGVNEVNSSALRQATCDSGGPFATIAALWMQTNTNNDGTYMNSIHPWRCQYNIISSQGIEGGGGKEGGRWKCAQKSRNCTYHENIILQRRVLGSKNFYGTPPWGSPEPPESLTTQRGGKKPTLIPIKKGKKPSKTLLNHLRT